MWVEVIELKASTHELREDTRIQDTANTYSDWYNLNLAFGICCHCSKCHNGQAMLEW